MSTAVSTKRLWPPLIALGLALLPLTILGRGARAPTIVIFLLLAFGCVLWLIGSALRPYLRPAWIVTLLSTLAVGAAALIATLLSEQRRATEDKSIATYQIHSAIEQFFSENPDRVFLRYDDLIGPRRFLKTVNPIAGEDYHELFPVRADTEIFSLTMGDGRKNLLVYLAKPDVRIVVRQSPEGKLTGAVAAYQTWFTAQDRRDGVHLTSATRGGRFETTWRGGVPDGPFRAYYADGKLWAEATYMRGAPVGRHVVYDQAGKIIYETVFVPWRRGG